MARMLSWYSSLNLIRRARKKGRMRRVCRAKREKLMDSRVPKVKVREMRK